MKDVLPFLDFNAPGFSTRGPEVLAARDKSWCARTPFGLAVLRHREAGQLLRDRRLRQGSYAWPDIMGLQGPFAEFWIRSIIGQEGDTHKALRKLAQTALSADYVAGLVAQFEAHAAILAEGLAGAEICEFIRDFSHPFAGRAVTTLMGLPTEDANWIASDAVSLGDAMGLDCKLHEPEFNAACARLTDLAQQLIDRARKGGRDETYITRLVAATDQQPTDAQAILDLVVISIFGGVDTTRAQLGFAMALFCEHPDQWQLLREDPDLIPQAIEEVIRAWPTTTWSTREAVEDFEFGGVELRQGETVHILAHATGTDPKAVPEWDFDITAPRKLHFGFGGGAHHCLGQLVARTDMAAALRVLSRRFAGVELAGTPEWMPDSGNTAPARLPLRFLPAPG